jgi:hypothetical protein
MKNSDPQTTPKRGRRRSRVARLQSLNEELLDALQFYARAAWQEEVREMRSGPPFRAYEEVVHRQCLIRPSAALFDDCGKIAREAISKAMDAQHD